VSEIHRCPNPECGAECRLIMCVGSKVGRAQIYCTKGCGYLGVEATGYEATTALHNAICRPAAPDDGKQAGLPSEAMRSVFWAAFNWNDHNCKVDDVLDACKRIAKSVGVESFDEANKWLTRAPDDGKGQPYRDALIKIQRICQDTRDLSPEEYTGEIYDIAEEALNES